jgi:hypothetical protein
MPSKRARPPNGVFGSNSIRIPEKPSDEGMLEPKGLCTGGI